MLQICDCTLSMNSRVWNLLIILTEVSTESSHLVIFSTFGFIKKFNVLPCISFKPENTILDRGQGSDTSHLNCVIACSANK